MTTHQRRLRAIELRLTPQQVVVAWLKKAQQAGSFWGGAQKPQPPRAFIADEICKIVRSSVKGQPQALVDRAINQARRVADNLFMLIIQVNACVQEETVHRRTELRLLYGYLRAVSLSSEMAVSVEELRLVAVSFAENVLVLQSAIKQIERERFSGHCVLLHDVFSKLEQQLQMSAGLAKYFDLLAGRAGVPELALDGLKDGIRFKVDQQISVWEGLARLETLAAFGNQKELIEAAEQVSKPVETRALIPVNCQPLSYPPNG